MPALSLLAALSGELPPLLKMSTNINQCSGQARGASRWHSHFTGGEASVGAGRRWGGSPEPSQPCLRRSPEQIALLYSPRAPALPWGQGELHSRHQDWEGSDSSHLICGGDRAASDQWMLSVELTVIERVKCGSHQDTESLDAWEG